MKTALLILMLLLASCASNKYIEVKCELEDAELFNQISGVLIQNGFSIKHTDYKTGVLTAEQEDHNIIVGKMFFYWDFVRKNGLIIAKAKMKTTAMTHLDDNTSSSWTQYWNVRNELENICKNKIIFRELQ